MADKRNSSKTKKANVSVENACHQEEDNNPTSANEDPLAELTAAVNRQREANNEVSMKKIEEKTDVTIKEAIKRALAKGLGAVNTKKRKKEPEFKSKGNKIRYEVNEEIIEKVDSAIDAINEEDIEAAREVLGSGKEILTKQQKLIRVADREEHGWEVVKHYLSDDLAGDSDDDKRLKEARKEAAESIKNRNWRKMRSRLPYQESYREWDTYENERAYERRLSCYECGEEGHFQYNCPLTYGR